jgi:hypothetical protein
MIKFVINSLIKDSFFILIKELLKYIKLYLGNYIIFRYEDNREKN